MTRDVIDSLMAGMLLSQLPIWQLQGPADKATMIMSLATLIFILIMKFKNEPQSWHP